MCVDEQTLAAIPRRAERLAKEASPLSIDQAVLSVLPFPVREKEKVRSFFVPFFRVGCARLDAAETVRVAGGGWG